MDFFSATTLQVAAISLETGYVTAPSVPHIIQNSFKNLAAIGIEVGYKFKEIENAGSAPAPAAAASKAPVAAKPVVEEKPAEVEEESIWVIFSVDLENPTKSIINTKYKLI